MLSRTFHQTAFRMIRRQHFSAAFRSRHYHHVLLSLLLLFSLSDVLVYARKRGPQQRLIRYREHLPIHDEDSLSGNLSSDAQSSGKKASECRFANKRYELESVWHPDLGSPFGVMYCVHCECVPIHKKRRIIGRVRCKNIKTECPKPTCVNPVLLPGRCCKVCPGTTDNPDLMIEVNLKKEEEEKNGRNYAALLRPRAVTKMGSSLSATGRFHFRKKTLSYSFVTSPDFGFPKLLTFLDSASNIIEEFPVHLTHMQKQIGKVCGAWQRIPRRYRRQLRQDDIYAQLTGSTDDAVISGRIAKHYGLSSELFSALLISEDSGSFGTATAVLSLQSATGSVHVNLLMSGIFGNDQYDNEEEEEEEVLHDFPIRVTFRSVHGDETRIIEEVMIVSRGKNSLASKDFKTVFDGPELDALGRGKLEIFLSIRHHLPPSTSVQQRISGSAATDYIVVEESTTRMRGILAPKFSCDIFDCVMIPVKGKNDDTMELLESPANEIQGLAWMFMHKGGDIKYHLRLQNIDEQQVPSSIHVTNGRKSRRLLRIIHNIEDNFNMDAGGEVGWANGSMVMNAADIEDLYRSKLFINVVHNGGNAHGKEVARCQIIPHQMNLAHELSSAPILMTSAVMASSSSSFPPMAGIAWTNIDSTCQINYHVRISGIHSNQESSTFTFFLKDYPIIQNSNPKVALAPAGIMQLQEFHGGSAEGHNDSLHKLTLARLNMEDASFVIIQNNISSGNNILEGRIKGVKVPSGCLPHFSRNELELMPGYLNDLGEERPEAGNPFATKCIYEESVYDDGDQWTATHEACKMCSCQRGKVVCDSILCPDVVCDIPVIPEGECCPICKEDLPQEETQGCFFEGDKKFHLAGTIWHPYIPPLGFSKCATCTCLTDTLQVECKRVECPPLKCPTELQTRPEPLACCRVCKEAPPTPKPTLLDPQRPQDMGIARTKEDVLSEGGCQWRDEVHENGASWHPSVLPFGIIKCVSCKCKDGIADCKRKSCPTLSCQYKVQDPNACCPRCAVNRAETKKARKMKRLMAIRKLRRIIRLREEKLQAERNQNERMEH